MAIEGATRVVQVVDGRSGLLPLDAELAQMLRRAGKPPLIVVNKADSAKQASFAAPFYEIGSEVFPVSAEHGFGIDALWQAATVNAPDLTAGNTFQAIALCRQSFNGLIPPTPCGTNLGCTAP